MDTARSEESSPVMWLDGRDRKNDLDEERYQIHPPSRKSFYQRYKRPLFVAAIVAVIVTIFSVMTKSGTVTLEPPPHAIQSGPHVNVAPVVQQPQTAILNDNDQSNVKDIYGSTTVKNPTSTDMGSTSTDMGSTSTGHDTSLESMDDVDVAALERSHQAWMSAQEERRLQLKQACEERGRGGRPLTKSVRTMMMLVDEYHKVILCTIPKAGCTSWKWLLVKLNLKDHPAQQKLYKQQTTDKNFFPGKIHKSGALKRYGLKKLGDLSKTQAEIALNSYTKIIAVRDPLDRMLSGYRDKLVPHADGNCPFCKKLGRNIIKHYRNGGPKDRKGRTVTTLEFLEALVGDKSKVNINGGHWATYESLCHPCDMQYDYIAHLETANQDSDHIVHWVFNSTIKLPHHNSAPSKSSTKPTDILKTIKPNIKNKILQLYGFDMDMFGYKWPE